MTDFHIDFQENFSVQLKGKKKWTFRRSTASMPLRGCSPHFSADGAPEIPEQQLKAHRLGDPLFQGDQFTLTGHCNSNTTTTNNNNNTSDNGKMLLQFISLSVFT